MEFVAEMPASVAGRTDVGSFERFVEACRVRAAGLNVAVLSEACDVGFAGSDCVSALVRYAYGLAERPRVPGRPVDGEDMVWAGVEQGVFYPSGVDGFNACGLLLRWAAAMDAPEDVIVRMREVSVEFGGWVLSGVNRHGERRNVWSYRGTDSA